jgi:hypothetical protein
MFANDIKKEMDYFLGWIRLELLKGPNNQKVGVYEIGGIECGVHLPLKVNQKVNEIIST